MPGDTDTAGTDCEYERYETEHTRAVVLFEWQLVVWRIGAVLLAQWQLERSVAGLRERGVRRYTANGKQC